MYLGTVGDCAFTVVIKSKNETFVCLDCIIKNSLFIPSVIIIIVFKKKKNVRIYI